MIDPIAGLRALIGSPNYASKRWVWEQYDHTVMADTLDILRDLKRIVAHLTSVAHPILEEEGELRSSRLRQGDRPPASG